MKHKGIVLFLLVCLNIGPSHATDTPSQRLENITVLAQFYAGKALHSPKDRKRLAQLLYGKFVAIAQSIKQTSEPSRKRQLARSSYDRYVSLLDHLATGTAMEPHAEMKLWAQLSSDLLDNRGHKALTALIQSGKAEKIDWIEGCPACLSEGRQSIGRSILIAILIPHLSDLADEAFLNR